MTVKKQIPSLCKLYSFYDEIPEEFLDETGVDSFYCHNIFDISQSQHRIVRVSRGSNKKSFAIKLFQFCDLKTKQRYILQEEVNLSKRKLTCLIDNLRDFLKIFDEDSKCIQIPLSKRNFEIGSTKSKDIPFAHYYNDIIEHPSRHIRLSFRFGNNNSCVFSIKKFELHGNHFILTEMVNLNHCEIHHLYKNRYYVANKCEMCSALTPDCGIDNSTIILIGDVSCPNTKCSGRLCLHENTFQSLGRSDYQCPQCASVCQVRNIPFEDQRNSFSCRSVKGFTFLKRTQNQFKMLLQMSLVLASIVPTERKVNLLVVM